MEPHHKHKGVNYELSLYVMNSFIYGGRESSLRCNWRKLKK